MSQVTINARKQPTLSRLSEAAGAWQLLYFLIWRDVKVRYRQAAFGASWAVLQPLAMMAIFAVFLGSLARIPSDGVPYVLFVYTGLVPWTFFANAFGGASTSLVENGSLVTKVYFPRILVPLAKVGAFLIDLAISTVLLLGMVVLYGYPPTVRWMLLPIFSILIVILALAIGVALSAVNVKYRDVRYAVPFLTQLWLFASPVAYPASLVPETWRWLYWLNPVAGAVEGFRWALLATPFPPALPMLLSIGMTIASAVGALLYFGRTETAFADVI